MSDDTASVKIMLAVFYFIGNGVLYEIKALRAGFPFTKLPKIILFCRKLL